MKRRDFIRGSLGAGAAALGALESAGAVEGSSGPITISSANGLRALDTAMERLNSGGAALDAVVAAVNMVEEDPNDITVGYGGLPNEKGIVELDASVMDGRSGRAGAVASLRNIKYPSRVARLVMEQTDHVLLVGEGALEFARVNGFTEENLLTERSRKIWLWWRQGLSSTDDWIRPPESEWPPEVREYVRTYGTVHCSAIDRSGSLAGATTTSGLFFKIPGRVGDSPVIGAGLYVDDAVGSCGSTGRGEEVLLNCGSFAVVEQLRRGLAPVDAGLEILKRIADRARHVPRLLKSDGTPDFDVKFYVMDRKGRHAGCSLWSGGWYAVHDGRQARTLETAWLFRRPSGGSS